MAFVPIPNSPTTHPSPRTRELADRLARVIQEYENDHPTVSGGEVRAALHLAARRARGKELAPRAAIMLSLGLIVALGVGFAIFITTQGGNVRETFMPVGVGVLMLLALFLVFAIRRS